jgi:hypothetical protein
MSVVRPSPFANFNPREDENHPNEYENNPAFIPPSGGGNPHINSTEDFTLDTVILEAIEGTEIRDLEMSCINYSPGKHDH